MQKICYVSSRLCKNAKKSFMYIKNSENTHFGQFSNDTLLFYVNRNKAEPREVTKQVVWIILRNRIFHRTIRHIRSGFPSYARTLCTLTLFAYALNQNHNAVFIHSTDLCFILTVAKYSLLIMYPVDFAVNLDGCIIKSGYNTLTTLLYFFK